MANKKMTYEGMFLVDPGEFQAASEPVRNILARSEAEVLAIKPWDERRLAYEILGRKRALYVLTYFNADPLKVVEIERDCQLDEKIVRVLILKKEQLKDEELNAETPMTSGRRTEDIEVQRDEEEDDRDRRPRRRPEPAEEAVEDIAEDDSDSEK